MKYKLQFSNFCGLYKALKHSLPEDFDGCAPEICAGFVYQNFGTRHTDFVLEVSTQPFVGSKQLIISKQSRTYSASGYIYTYWYPKGKYWKDFYSDAYDFLSYLTKNMKIGNRRIYIKLSA